MTSQIFARSLCDSIRLLAHRMPTHDAWRFGLVSALASFGLDLGTCLVMSRCIMQLRTIKRFCVYWIANRWSSCAVELEGLDLLPVSTGVPVVIIYHHVFGWHSLPVAPSSFRHVGRSFGRCCAKASVCWSSFGFL